MYYTLFKYGLFRPGIALGMRPTVEGQENLPVGQAAILAGNHIGAWDPVVLLAMIQPTVHMVGKAELFAPGGSPRHRIVAAFLKAVEQVPMDRAGGSAGLRPVLDTLACGEVVGIFPEGTRSPDGRLYKGKTGVARLALHSGAPVIPIAITGTVPRRGRLGLPWISRPRFVIGQPLRYDDLAPLADDHDALRWVTNDIMATIQQMTGQEYVDVYAADVKRGKVTDADVAAATGVDPRHGQPRPTV